MPAARGMKRTASKSSASTAATAPKSKKKRGPILLEIPTAPKKRGRVLTCGQGDVGQLGLGEDVVETTKFTFVTALGDKIVDTHAGGMHTIALDNRGKVWTFGCNDEGALGRATSGESEEGTPGIVPLPESAVAIVAGDSHSAALLYNGDVYAWGAFRDSHGSMGLVMRGREGKSCREPVKLDLPEPAVDLASGGDHLVVLTNSGSVYTMGCGEQGQLGRLAQRSATRDARQGFSALLNPSKVTLKVGASRVWAGYHATFALDANKEKVFAWGLNNYGQLGITGEKRKTAVFLPTQCDAFASRSEWNSVAAGQHHSLALDSAGQVYAVGRCEYGRLGLGDRAGDAETLEPIPKLSNKKCVSISAGTSNSFAVTDSGEVFAWGMGSEGQLGTGQCSDANEPTIAVNTAFQDRLPLAVSAGGQHTVLLVIDPTEQRELSPSPEKEVAVEKTEDVEDAEEEVEEKEKEKKPRGKRQKKDQEGEVSSTSTAQVSEVTHDNKPEKINGAEKKETPMEVDETDNTEDKKEEEKESTTEAKQDESQTDSVQDVPMEAETAEPPSEEANEPGQAEEAPSQTAAAPEQTLAAASETEAVPSQIETAPSETVTAPGQSLAEPSQAETATESVNGTEEMEVVESKTVEASLPPATAPLTTTA